MTVLHINSSARLSNSNTRIIGQYLVGALGEQVIAQGKQQVDTLISTLSTSDILGAA